MSDDLRSKGVKNEVTGAAKEAEGKIRDAAADITGDDSENLKAKSEDNGRQDPEELRQGSAGRGRLRLTAEKQYEGSETRSPRRSRERPGGFSFSFRFDPSPELLVPQRLDRVEHRRASRRPHAEHHADCRREHERHDHGRRRDLRVPLEAAAQHVGRTGADGDPDDPAEDAEHDRFDQELRRGYSSAWRRVPSGRRSRASAR